ncbi:DeoR/GlpR family DNA-binding transcription regulator [Paeniglutamicibacter terrestris]|uniref:DeoR/GlpR transcriptional regulator n=1 Tax=Paeniglutamicibacter terrestris TaxID=2723403 RepID=A0ABX1G383_9MICC|nr:DeoR/GlpR family DNA-binding transcription regulator [Paeniglutamicibacter terrestris]ASN37881.1 DeoR family transcriptional regulator [Arthrobacter sp. 7749]NKG19922.1 DeoR/GlpR transcriptional regulator [Paeniglutamicibacter terrestris]
MSTSARVRQGQILELAHTSGLASVEELSERFDVTASTIRRDLTRLTSEGKIARTYGGAMALNGQVVESTFRQRNKQSTAAKRAIGRRARALVKPGQSILLDSGSTVAALAHELRDASELKLATTSLVVLDELAEAQEIHVECIGGTLRHSSAAFVGPLAEYCLERMSFDTVFLGADGVTPEAICEADMVQTRLKEVMCSRANTVYVLADSSKLNHTPFHAWARLPEAWTLITDAAASDAQLEAFRAAGVKILIAR